jgi:hypothetical protein
MTRFADSEPFDGVVEARDPVFWRQVFEHPEVKPKVGLGHALDIAALVADRRVTPLRARHGGYLFVQLDGLGRVYELHSLFTPEGWGREALLAAKAAFTLMFAAGAHVITTMEVRGNRRSQPPRSFRFRPAGGFAAAAPFKDEFRSWVLTRDDWENSPVNRRSKSCLSQQRP